MRKLAVLLIVALMLMPLCISANAAGKKITDYSAGDIIEFGSYPQSQVADYSLINALSAKAGNKTGWTSYYYCRGNGSKEDGRINQSDYMKYKDVEYNGEKYRGIYFTAFRPVNIFDVCSAENSQQDENGYYINTEYWFRFEPVKWIVLNPKTGMVISKYLLDSQAFHSYFIKDGTDDYSGYADTYYVANRYRTSSIRAWLNDDFYNTVFSASQRAKVQTVYVDNTPYDSTHSAFQDTKTDEKVYLLSVDELDMYYTLFYNYYSDEFEHQYNGMLQCTDYALSQGLYHKNNGNTQWIIRTAWSSSDTVGRVCFDGIDDGGTYSTNNGILPVTNLKTDVSLTDSNGNVIQGNVPPEKPSAEIQTEAVSSTEAPTQAITSTETISETSTEASTNATTEADRVEEEASTTSDSTDKKKIIIIAACAVSVVIAGAAALLVVIIKKNKGSV